MIDAGTARPENLASVMRCYPSDIVDRRPRRRAGKSCGPFTSRELIGLPDRATGPRRPKSTSSKPAQLAAQCGIRAAGVAPSLPPMNMSNARYASPGQAAPSDCRTRPHARQGRDPPSTSAASVQTKRKTWRTTKHHAHHYGRSVAVISPRQTPAAAMAAWRSSGWNQKVLFCCHTAIRSKRRATCLIFGWPPFSGAAAT